MIDEDVVEEVEQDYDLSPWFYAAVAAEAQAVSLEAGIPLEGEDCLRVARTLWPVRLGVGRREAGSVLAAAVRRMYAAQSARACRRER